MIAFASVFVLAFAIDCATAANVTFVNAFPNVFTIVLAIAFDIASAVAFVDAFAIAFSRGSNIACAICLCRDELQESA